MATNLDSLYTQCPGFELGAVEGTPESMFCANCCRHRKYHARGALQRPPPSPQQPQQDGHRRRANRASATPNNEVEQPQQHDKRRRANRASATPIDEVDYESDEHDSKRKRRTRTKFTEVQKSRMREFAEKTLEWKPQRYQDEEIKNFCTEIAIDPVVYKVWIKNNRRRHMRTIGVSSSAPNL